MEKKSRSAGLIFLILTILTAALMVTAFAPEARAVKARWTDTYNGETGESDFSQGVAVSPDGSVYVTGDITVTAPWMDIWVRKYK